MPPFFRSLVLVIFIFALLPIGYGQSPRNNSADTNDPIARIRDEGLNHSQVMETLSTLTEVIGPRLTGSPNLKRANEWTRDQLLGWGLKDLHLEAWGPFGRGWSLKRFSAQVIEPQSFPLIGYPNAWSPGLEKPLVAEVVHFKGGTNDMEKLKGKLAGRIVLNGQSRDLPPRFEPLATRSTETDLLRLANAGDPSEEDSVLSPGGPASSTRRGPGAGRTGTSDRLASVVTRAGIDGGRDTNSTSGPAIRARGGFRGRPGGRTRSLSFLAREKAALIVSPSSLGDGGTFVVAAAAVPGPEPQGRDSQTNIMRPWATNAPTIPPQITIAAEDFNRLARMLQHGENVKMVVELEVRFHAEDFMAYNTIAEIPGTDLKPEIVMLGAHLDSWHSGTGATDNGAGVAATMEAVRILTALKLQPRRTIRIGLWSGEEQGLLGSKAYVARHFGYYTNRSGPSAVRAPKDEESADPASRTGSTNSTPPRKLIRGAEYDHLSAYFNLDNGAGKIRGVYLQGNEAVRPLFRRWLEPFSDLGAQTLTLSNTGGTDHIPFDSIGLPGFQFIQDPLEYGTRTHHSNQDLLDRVLPDDLKQISIILAALVYDAAMADEKLPRKIRED